MIQLQVERASVDAVQDYLERVKQRILAGIRAGMQEAMENLAGTAIEQMSAAGIQSRSGALVEAIGDSPKATETTEVIRGTVSSNVGIKNLGLWLEEGIHDPAVKGKLYQFTAPDGSTVYTRGHRAFDVKPHPFLNPALEASKQPIMDVIAARVAEAY